MSKILSEFHFSLRYIDGSCLKSPATLHDELSFKLGLPTWYGRNWDALTDCLSSIGSKTDNMCLHWDWVSGKRLVFSIRDFVADNADSRTLLSFVQVVSDANCRLAQQESLNRIWIEYIALDPKTT